MTIETLFDKYLQMFRSTYPNYTSQIDNFIDELKSIMAAEVCIKVLI